MTLRPLLNPAFTPIADLCRAEMLKDQAAFDKLYPSPIFQLDPVTKETPRMHVLCDTNAYLLSKQLDPAAHHMPPVAQPLIVNEPGVLPPICITVTVTPKKTTLAEVQELDVQRMPPLRLDRLSRKQAAKLMICSSNCTVRDIGPKNRPSRSCLITGITGGWKMECGTHRFGCLVRADRWFQPQTDTGRSGSE